MGSTSLQPSGNTHATIFLSRLPGHSRTTDVIVVALVLACVGCPHRQTGKYLATDAVLPGIFLDPEDSFPIPKGDLRPVIDTGIHLTKESEGFRAHLYEDAAKYCTIAYGHLVKKAPCNGTEPPDLRRGITEPEGARLLDVDMTRARQAVTALVEVRTSDGQYGALCDFVYNVGAANFRNSTLLRDVNRRRTDDIPIQFRRWILADGKELSALKKRREREIALFFGAELIPKAVPYEGENVSQIDIRKGE